MERQKISNEVLHSKYMINGEKDEDEIYRGVAEEISSVEYDSEKCKEWYNKYYNLLSQNKLIGGGRQMANARPYSKQKNYNNCFVIDIEDSLDSIFDTIKKDAIIGKAGGGVGINVSKLRPKGDTINTGGDSSGPISFLDIIDTSAKTIHTGGGRRGAHIAVMDITHPDIEEFITVKREPGRLTQFNLSIGISDEFMEAVEEDANWNLTFNNKIYKTVKSRYLYDLIMTNMFLYDEPGVLFF